MAEAMANLNRAAELGHLHELYKYPQNTIYVPGRTVYEIGTFTLPKGLWLLSTNWYLYGSSPTWPASSWYRMGYTPDPTDPNIYLDVLNYKCMDVNESYQGVQVVDVAEDKTVHLNTYASSGSGAAGTYNVYEIKVCGVKIR